MKEVTKSTSIDLKSTVRELEDSIQELRCRVDDVYKFRLSKSLGDSKKSMLLKDFQEHELLDNYYKQRQWEEILEAPIKECIKIAEIALFFRDFLEKLKKESWYLTDFWDLKQREGWQTKYQDSSFRGIMTRYTKEECRKQELPIYRNRATGTKQYPLIALVGAFERLVLEGKVNHKSEIFLSRIRIFPSLWGHAE